MVEPTITCPSCKSEIKLTESLAAPLIEATREQFQKQLRDKEDEVRRREAALANQKQDLEKQRHSLEEQISERLTAEREKIVAEEARNARAALAGDLDQKTKQIGALQEVLKERSTKLEEAQKAQAELLRKERELEDARREVELTVEKRVQESLGSVRDKARKEAEDSLQLRVREKEEQISSMQRQIEELKRKAEQGSQQLQGEVLELELEAVLSSRFPFDRIEPVPKGEFGGDLVQRVVSPAGQQCGTILWEMKRTRNWSDGWLSKLRSDQRAAKAEIALIVTQTLPKDMQESFALLDGVWVTGPTCAVPVAVALRESLIGLAAARATGEGQLTKTEQVYRYLTGPRFRHRVEAIVETFTEMQNDLDRERKAMNRLWSKREEQIRCVVDSTAGMYGDLQGIAGRSLQEIEGLELPLLDAPSIDSETTD